VQLFELEKIFEETSSVHWEVITGGPTFLHGYRVGGSQNEARISGVEEHYSVAVLRADIDLRIAWGYDPDFGRREEYSYFKEHTFADPAVSTELGDVFYRGALVQRHWLLSVDGSRALLPMPTARHKDGASLISEDPNDYEQFVTQRQVNFARLVNDLRESYADFEEYLRRSGFVVDPA
jgi:hypothetical protein